MFTIKQLLTDSTLFEKEVSIAGWVRSVRNSKKFSFLSLYDGSCISTLQIFLDKSLANYQEVAGLLMGSSVEITGKLVASPGAGQSVEMQAKIVTIFSEVDTDFPLQKKAISMEYLREIPNLRVRTTAFGAILRIRDLLSRAIHDFFHSQGFYYIQSPIITGIDAEGAGEMFRVTTLKLGESNAADDYFGQDAYLAVTGQLEAELLIFGLGRVYTFAPTFRAENSNTSRHLSEFWMIEPEMAFFTLEDLMNLAEEFLKHLIKTVLEAKDDLQFLLNLFEKPDHEDKLKSILNSTFKRITYTEAVDFLEKSGEPFEFPVSWGIDLQSEHEKYITKVYGPTIVTDYPKKIKAFYMKENEDKKTVRGMDVLFPEMGEVIGGSQREDDYQKLKTRMEELNMDISKYSWYLDLRKNGSVPHSGFGLGFDRFLAFLIGAGNIRDVVPYPRTPKNIKC